PVIPCLTYHGLSPRSRPRDLLFVLPSWEGSRSGGLRSAILVGALQDLRRERNDLHVLFPAQLARDRTEDAGSHRFALSIDQHAGVAVELDVRPIVAPDALGSPHDDRLADLALLDGRMRDRLFNSDHDDVAQARSEERRVGKGCRSR